MRGSNPPLKLRPCPGSFVLCWKNNKNTLARLCIYYYIPNIMNCFVTSTASQTALWRLWSGLSGLGLALLVPEVVP